MNKHKQLYFEWDYRKVDRTKTRTVYQCTKCNDTGKKKMTLTVMKGDKKEQPIGYVCVGKRDDGYFKMCALYKKTKPKNLKFTYLKAV